MLSLNSYIRETAIDITNVPFSEAEKIKNADESIKKFLPSVWNEISGSFQLIFPVLTNELKDETNIFLKNTKGLNHSKAEASSVNIKSIV